MIKYIFFVTIIFFGFGNSMAQECKSVNYWLEKADSKFSISDEMNTQETLKAMTCLIENKGNKSKANTGTASRSSKNSQRFASPTIEVVALYCISYLFYENSDFANAIALQQDDEDKINSRKALKIAFSSYNKWLKKVKEIGLEEARKQKLDPLADSGVSWY